ncbi:hypothetical protein PIB30_058134 [Stylosanthes scabra]|uniref:Uncharacterized protein n=1 Tax=Stylosanthes scabra TaxID=79078 RepID=A0ABU6ULH7_9FABA|nr:hypothetical protein [Stylosanthes scabra]
MPILNPHTAAHTLTHLPIPRIGILLHASYTHMRAADTTPQLVLHCLTNPHTHMRPLAPHTSHSHTASTHRHGEQRLCTTLHCQPTRTLHSPTHTRISMYTALMRHTKLPQYPSTIHAYAFD